MVQSASWPPSLTGLPHEIASCLGAAVGDRSGAVRRRSNGCPPGRFAEISSSGCIESLGFSRPAAPVSSRFRVAFLLAQLPFRFHATTIRALSQSLEKRARLCRHRQSRASWPKLPPSRGAACLPVQAGCAPTSKVDHHAGSRACCEMFSSTPVARSITSKLEPP